MKVNLTDSQISELALAWPLVAENNRQTGLKKNLRDLATEAFDLAGITDPLTAQQRSITFHNFAILRDVILKDFKEKGSAYKRQRLAEPKIRVRVAVAKVAPSPVLQEPPEAESQVSAPSTRMPVRRYSRQTKVAICARWLVLRELHPAARIHTLAVQAQNDVLPETERLFTSSHEDEIAFRGILDKFLMANEREILAAKLTLQSTKVEPTKTESVPETPSIPEAKPEAFVVDRTLDSPNKKKNRFWTQRRFKATVSDAVSDRATKSQLRGVFALLRGQSLSGRKNELFSLLEQISESQEDLIRELAETKATVLDLKQQVEDLALDEEERTHVSDPTHHAIVLLSSSTHTQISQNRNIDSFFRDKPALPKGSVTVFTHDESKDYIDAEVESWIDFLIENEGKTLGIFGVGPQKSLEEKFKRFEKGGVKIECVAHDDMMMHIHMSCLFAGNYDIKQKVVKIKR